MTVHSNPGLDGIVAAATRLSHVDGEKGELVIAGRHVADLVGTSDFEGVARQLMALTGLDTSDADFRSQLGAVRRRTFARLPLILALTRGMPVISGFRAAVSAIDAGDGLPEEMALLGAMPVLAAALVRQAAGEAPVAPDPAVGHAADMLRMMRGRVASVEEARALDIYLITVCDHGMNASTFAARVVASTQADLTMAVTAGYCALTGPLHGGAPGPVLDMLDAIGTADAIKPWIDAAIARGDRLMGFGHRIYRARDPRADVLKGAVEGLGASHVDLGLAARVEAYARQALARAKPDRRLDTNVEFYTAILLDALGIPRQAFTPIFAAARTAGWIAHAREQRHSGRLLRPASTYIGAMPGSGGQA